MNINKDLLDNLSLRASQSDRLRINMDMRNTLEDNSQRMLNAIEPGTVVPIHRHRSSTESCILLRGSAEEVFYDDNGNVTERVLMEVGSDCVGVDIDKGRWHTIISLQSGTVIFEAKDGPYEPLSKEDILNV